MSVVTTFVGAAPVQLSTTPLVVQQRAADARSRASLGNRDDARAAGRASGSVWGDGGFLSSAMELETAVREKRSFVHFVWRDGTYDMVAAQEVMK